MDNINFEVCQMHGFIEPCYRCEQSRRIAELSKASADENYEFWKRSWQKSSDADPARPSAGSSN